MATVELGPSTAAADHQAEAQAVVAQVATQAAAQAAAQAEHRGQATPTAISPSTTMLASVHVERQLTPRRKCSSPSVTLYSRR